MRIDCDDVRCMSLVFATSGGHALHSRQAIVSSEKITYFNSPLTSTLVGQDVILRKTVFQNKRSPNSVNRLSPSCRAVTWAMARIKSVDARSFEIALRRLFGDVDTVGVLFHAGGAARSLPRISSQSSKIQNTSSRFCLRMCEDGKKAPS